MSSWTYDIHDMHIKFGTHKWVAENQEEEQKKQKQALADFRTGKHAHDDDQNDDDNVATGHDQQIDQPGQCAYRRPCYPKMQGDTVGQFNRLQSIGENRG